VALGGGSGGGARGIKAGEAYVTLGAKDNLTKHLKGVAGRFAAIGKALVGMTGVSGMLSSVLGAAVSLDHLFETAGELTRLEATAKAFGLTTEAASGLFAVLAAGGSDIRDATEGLVTLGQRVSDAVAGKGEEAVALFDGLGVAASEFAGLNPAEQFYKLHASLLAVEDPAKRVQLLLKAVGEDTGKNLISTLSMSTDMLRQQAAAMSLSRGEMEQVGQMNRSYLQAQQSLNRTWQQAVVVLAPFIQQVATGLMPVLQVLFNYLRDRDLGDMFGEAGARLTMLSADIKHAFTGTVLGITDFFIEAWNNAVLTVKNLFADLADFVSGSLSKALQKPLMALAVINPQLAGAIQKAIAGGGAVGPGMRQQAKEEFDRAEAFRTRMRDIAKAERDAERGVLQGAIDAIEKRVAAKRQQRIWADLMEMPLDAAAKKMGASVGRSLGAFGAGSLFKQAFGAQGAEGVAKKQLDEQKKTNVKLGDVVKAVQNIGFPVFQ
jgi:hypothetical protein